MRKDHREDKMKDERGKTEGKKGANAAMAGKTTELAPVIDSQVDNGSKSQSGGTIYNPASNVIGNTGDDIDIHCPDQWDVPSATA